MGGGLRGNLRWSTQKVSAERETGCLCKSSPNIISAITETCIANNTVMFGFYRHRLCQVFKCCESLTLVCLLLIHPGLFFWGEFGLIYYSKLGENIQTGAMPLDGTLALAHVVVISYNVSSSSAAH